MRRLPMESWEKALALLVVAGCGLAVVVTRAEVGAAEQCLLQREAKHERLLTLLATGDVDSVDPRELDGLFAETALQWQRSGPAVFLQLHSVAGAR